MIVPASLCRAAAVVALTVLAPAVCADEVPLAPQARPVAGVAAAAGEPWRVIESVLTHPRCLNCHTASDYPRQGDDRRRHQFRVVRGPADRGVPGALCTACHQEDNQASSGVPGAPGWRLAPVSMAFEKAPGVALRGKELCERLLDKKRNGGMELRGLELHFENEALLQWAWAPGSLKDGSPRVAPPVTQEELLRAAKEWSAAGGPCPR